MIRDAVAPELRCKTAGEFARRVATVERRVMEVLGSRPLSHATALQCISESTGWNENEDSLWLECAFLVDVFLTCSVSTAFSQAEISVAVASAVTLDASLRRNDLSDEIEKARAAYFGSQAEEMLKDPYFGVRVRHHKNPFCLQRVKK